jgi:hypothetical protein
VGVHPNVVRERFALYRRLLAAYQAVVAAGLRDFRPARGATADAWRQI